jgi:hypothetical protein
MVMDGSSAWSLITSDVSRGAGSLALLSLGMTAIVCSTLIVLVVLIDKDKRADVVGCLVPVLLALASRRRRPPGSSTEQAVPGESRGGDESGDGSSRGS